MNADYIYMYSNMHMSSNQHTGHTEIGLIVIGKIHSDYLTNY